MNDIHPDLVLTVPEVAEFLKLAPSTIYRLAKAGKLPGRKVGGAWRFSRQGIGEWLRETDEPPTHDTDGKVRK